MNGDKFIATEVKVYRLDHPCNEAGCPNILTIKMAGTTADANAAKSSLDPPDVNGWVDGYCPDHADHS